MKRFFSLLLVIAFSVFITPSVEAKTLPQAKKAITTVTKKATGTTVGISARLRRDRKAITVSFSNTQNANSISYILIYQTNGKEEGAGGSVKPTEGYATRELLFGTCSSGICRYHPSITNARLEITTELKSGKKTLRRYRIRV